MPQANSRFSRPRAISPSASLGTLPCSAVSSAASSLRCWSTRFRMRNMMSVRFDRDVARHAGNACRRCCDRGRDLLGRGEIDVLRQSARCGVEDRPLTTGRPDDRPPADPVADPARRGRLRAGGARLCDLCHGESTFPCCTAGSGGREHWCRLTILPAPARLAGRSLRRRAPTPGRSSAGPRSS